jgi:GH15 family glucan-1,4-alpha-glucosidase
MIATTDAITRRLGAGNGLLYRYLPDVSPDGLPGHEGAFLLCSFWLVDNLLLLGRHDDAHRLFERLLSIRNDVGLLSEGYDAERGQLAGNFPQAFSHIGLINTAFNLSRLRGPAVERGVE